MAPTVVLLSLVESPEQTESEGWFPAAYVRTWDVALPLAKQAELASNSFARRRVIDSK